jgi:hypothetical protein
VCGAIARRRFFNERVVPNFASGVGAKKRVVSALSCAFLLLPLIFPSYITTFFHQGQRAGCSIPLDTVMISAHSINERAAKSFIGRWFRLEGSGHPLERPGAKFLTELRAGTVTAAAMLYVGGPGRATVDTMLTPRSSVSMHPSCPTPEVHVSARRRLTTPSAPTTSITTCARTI